MRLSGLTSLQLLAACSTTALAAALTIALPRQHHDIAPTTSDHTQDAAGPATQHQQQRPLVHVPAMPPPSSEQQDSPPVQSSIMLSDVMGRDRSMTLFAEFARDVAAVSERLDSAAQNSTVLAPLNSAVEALPRKPWEDAGEYSALGVDAYEGGDGRERAARNMRRFVEAHVLPVSPWREGQRVRSLLSSSGGEEGENGDREVWWEMKNGKKVIFPDEIEVSSIASRVGNGEVWIVKGVRNYAGR
ncbi:hypothetical protein Micbo1qcDRAFT_237228 [Microdochium bolleyi]|uniref:FAS1 domain-containing protein n=1 Tax=Microdochium bolleyi TaxID=196109 RepID=A0A136ILX8_9PEZI|nr:hypothetical protein Micbo1qcDRAFT_237228 [Microdochium bolleyi]